MKNERTKLIIAVVALVGASVLLFRYAFGGGGRSPEPPATVEVAEQEAKATEEMAKIDPRATEPGFGQKQPLERVPRSAIKPGQTTDQFSQPADSGTEETPADSETDPQ